MINVSQHIKILKAAFISSCFFVCGCENKMEDVEELGKSKLAKDEAINVDSYMSQQGKVKAHLTSPLMLRTQLDTPLTEFPKTLHVDFYNDSTQIESRLFAKYGRYFENKGQVMLRDSVIVYNVKGDTLFTEELWWDREKQKFFTNKRVIIHQPNGQYFVGIDGLDADQSFRTWTLHNGYGLRSLPDSTMP